jgi:hypothetical protein
MASHSVYNHDICEFKNAVNKRILESKICYNFDSDRT